MSLDPHVVSEIVAENCDRSSVELTEPTADIAWVLLASEEEIPAVCLDERDRKKRFACEHPAELLRGSERGDTLRHHP